MLNRFRNVSHILKRRIKIINVYCNIGQKKIGVEQGGFHVIKHLIDTPSVSLLSNLMDIKCILIDNNNKYYYLKNAVQKSLDENEITLIFGGDHSISSASLPAFLDKYREDAHILWIDAHADINTKHSSLTNNSHGMSLAKVFGLMENDVDQKYYPRFSQLTYLGLREIDPFENEIIKKNNICVWDVNDIRNHKLNYNKFKNKKLYISIDVDVLDFIDMPSTGTVSKNGLLLEELITCLQRILMNNNVKCLDIVEFNPLIGTDKEIMKSTKNINKLLANLLLYVSPPTFSIKK